MKNRIDFYLAGERIPIRLNGYALALLGDKRPTPTLEAALCDLLRTPPAHLSAAMAAFCAQYGVARSWLCEYALCRYLA